MYYSLRTIIPDSGIEKNQILGDSYTIIKNKAENFKDIFAAYFDVQVYSRSDFYGEEGKTIYGKGDPNNPYMGRGLTGDLEYDKKFFWVDAADAFEKGFKFIYADGYIHYLESATAVVPNEYSRVKAFISYDDNKAPYPIKKGDWNFIVMENGTTYEKL